MGFWVLLGLWVGSMILGKVLSPRTKPIARSPQGPGEIVFPTSEVGRPVPVAFGTVIVRGPNVLWYGDSAITGAGPYSYFYGLSLGVCMGVMTKLTEVRLNDVALTSKISVTSGNRQIVFKKGASSDITAFIPIFDYETVLDFCYAAQHAMDVAAQLAGIIQKWRIGYGYIFGVANFDPTNTIGGSNKRMGDTLEYSVTVSGVSTHVKATLRHGNYIDSNQDTLASYNVLSEIGRALNVAENAAFPGAPRGVFTATKVANKIVITISSTVGGYTGWTLYGSGGITIETDPYGLANPNLGFKLLPNQAAVANAVTADVATFTKRYWYAVDATDGVMRFSQAGFTARSPLFGESTVDQTIDVYVGSGTKIPAEAHMAIYRNTEGGPPWVDPNSSDAVEVYVDAAGKWASAGEGGIEGRVNVWRGYPGQTNDPYLSTVEGGSTHTGFRGLVYAVMEKFYLGDTNYPKPIGFVLQCSHARTGMLDIGTDDNPAAVLWWILTDPTDWRGLPSAAIDNASFQAAGATLLAEGLGYSALIEQQRPAEELIDEILQQIDGTIYDDPSTGLVTLKLARGGYTVSALPLLDKTNCTVTRFRRRSFEETKNVVRVKYVDAASNWKDGIYEVQNLANVESRSGELSVQEFAFPGITNAAAAGVVANRLLRSLSLPLVDAELTVNREGWSLRPGDLFRLTWGPYSAVDLPMRVTRISDGTLEDGTIKIDAVEDPYHT